MIAIAKDEKDENKDYRFQVIGLTEKTRSSFVAQCKLNGTTATKVLRDYMKEYVARSAE